MSDIAVVTLNDKSYADIGQLTGRVKQAYCKRHGYDYYHYNDLLDPERAAPYTAWNKIPAILKHLKDHKWVFWIDADAVMIRPEVKLEQFLDPQRDVLFACDIEGINSGVAFYQNTPKTWEFLTKAYAREDWKERKTTWEQTAFKMMLREDWHAIRYSILGDFINSNPAQAAGRFIVHTWGMHPKVRWATLEEYCAPVAFLPEGEDVWLVSYFKDAAARFLEVDSVPMGGGSWKLARRGWDGYLNSTNGESEQAILQQYEGFNVVSVSMNKPPLDARFDVVFWDKVRSATAADWLPWMRGAIIVCGVARSPIIKDMGFHHEIHRSKDYIFLK